MQVHQVAIPMMLASCKVEDCARDSSHSIAELYFYGGDEKNMAGFYCNYCLDEIDVDNGQPRVSLAQEILRRTK